MIFFLIKLNHEARFFRKGYFVFFLFFGGIASAFSVEIASAAGGRWQEKIEQHLNTLITQGRDTYGPVTTPLFMAVLCDKTLTAPESPDYATVKKVPSDQRAVGGANLWSQQDLLRLLHRLSDVQPHFGTAADEHLVWYIDHLAEFNHHGQNGMLWWGDHLYYNAMTDQRVSESKMENQINLGGAGASNPVFLWERMWDLRPVAAEQQTELIWTWFVYDKQNGCWDRHAKNRENWAVGFSQAGASFIHAFSVAYRRTGDTVWKERAEKIRDHMWSQRDETSGLIPSAANTCPNRGADFWRRRFASSGEPGYWVPALLHGYEVFGTPEWLDQAHTILKGYLIHAYDRNAAAFYKWIRIDGFYDPDYSMANNPSGPTPDPSAGTVESGYSAFWRDDYNFRNNGRIALACLDLYDVSPDPAVLEGARIIGDQILSQNPRSDSGSGGAAAGAWADNYADALEILRRLHGITGEQQYLDRAVFVAEHGIRALWNPQIGIFRAHSRCGYETSGGTDRWCEQLFELKKHIEYKSGIAKCGGYDAVSILCLRQHKCRRNQYLPMPA